jgi:hypothetical protein
MLNIRMSHIIHITYDMYIIFITNSHIKRDLACQRRIMSQKIPILYQKIHIIYQKNRDGNVSKFG